MSITTKPVIYDGKTHYKPVVDGKPLNMIAETEDIAIILALGHKYDGINSKFGTMACRMLNIKSVWSE